MGLTSAALALGSRVFSEQNLPALANSYQQAAINIYQRARASDALPIPAFERDQVNDFYRDNNSDDNMGLAAIELYKLTKQREYLNQAKFYAEKVGNGKWAAWCCLTSSLNYQLSKFYDLAEQHFTDELTGYRNYHAEQGNIWGTPMPSGWGPLPGAAIAASYDGLHYLKAGQPDPQMLWNNIDYFLGRNNWGVSFIAVPWLSKVASNVYSQVYQLSGEYPLGAVSEGPGSKDTYQDLQAYFTPSNEDDYYREFNTSEQVFFDNSSNFQTMESTIVGQATAIYMLTIASKVTSSTQVKYSITQANDIAQSVPSATVSAPKKTSSSSGGASYYLLIFLVAAFANAKGKFNGTSITKKHAKHSK